MGGVNSSVPLPGGSWGALAPHAGIDDFGVLAVPAVRHALSFQNQFCLGVLVPAKLWLTSTVCEPRTIRLLFGAPRPTRIQGTPLARTAGGVRRRAGGVDGPNGLAGGEGRGRAGAGASGEKCERDHAERRAGWFRDLQCRLSKDEGYEPSIDRWLRPANSGKPHNLAGVGVAPLGQERAQGGFVDDGEAQLFGLGQLRAGLVAGRFVARGCGMLTPARHKEAVRGA